MLFHFAQQVTSTKLHYSSFIMVSWRKNLCIPWMNLYLESYLLKLSEECQEVQKKKYAHEPFAESTHQMGMVSLCE